MEGEERRKGGEAKRLGKLKPGTDDRWSRSWIWAGRSTKAVFVLIPGRSLAPFALSVLCVSASCFSFPVPLERAPAAF